MRLPPRWRISAATDSTAERPYPRPCSSAAMLRRHRPERMSEPEPSPPPVDVEERHQKTDGPVTVQDEPGPGRVRVDVRLGQGLHDRCDQVLLVRADPQADRGLEGVRGDLFQAECACHAVTLETRARLGALVFCCGG